VPSAGTYAIAGAAAPAGSFTPSLPTASATLTIGGVAYVATLPSAPATDVWMSGPLAYEGRSVVTPAGGAGAHPFLRVNFDTRVYSDGKGRVDVSVENVLDKTGATTVTYDVSIVVNGATVFTKAAVQHYYLTRWRKVFAIAGTTAASITPDFVPFQASRILPKYLSLVANQVSAPTGVDYDILMSGALDPNMPAHGGRAELAPYPDWTARYLVHKDQTQRSFVLANGDLSGSWPCTCARRKAARSRASEPNAWCRSISARRCGTTRARRPTCSTTSRARRCRSSSTARSHRARPVAADS
jgi:hypothetical protein